MLRTASVAWLALSSLLLTLLTGAQPADAQVMRQSGPIVSQRADPAVMRHSDGYYYMTASVPDYKRVELRRSTTLAGLGSAAPVTAFAAPSSGPLSGYLWAPDIRFYDGAWYLYFSGGPASAPFDQRMFWMRNTSANPLQGTWTAPQRLYTGWDSFSLDPASFELKGIRYLLWAQSEPGIATNSNIYIARMNTPTSIAGAPVRVAVPTYAWEREGYAVNEGPQVVLKNGRVFVAYSASATDARYKLGLLSSWANANLLDPASWFKHPAPVFSSANGVYGPGHGSFTVAEDGRTDVLVYHARDYDPPSPDALTDPNRHTRVQQLYWRDNGDPFFGQPLPNGAVGDKIRGAVAGKCVDNYNFDVTPGALVRMYDCNGNRVQQFDFDHVGNGVYRILNLNTNTCLDNINGRTTSNADVGLYPCNGTSAQQWTLRDRGNGWFQLYNVAGRMCLDNYALDRANGARVSLYPCNDSTAQRWRRD